MEANNNNFYIEDKYNSTNTDWGLMEQLILPKSDIILRIWTDPIKGFRHNENDFNKKPNKKDYQGEYEFYFLNDMKDWFETIEYNSAIILKKNFNFFMINQHKVDRISYNEYKKEYEYSINFLNELVRKSKQNKYSYELKYKKAQKSRKKL